MIKFLLMSAMAIGFYLLVVGFWVVVYRVRRTMDKYTLRKYESETLTDNSLMWKWRRDLTRKLIACGLWVKDRNGKVVSLYEVKRKRRKQHEAHK
jgi:hypothetical protein